MVLSGLPLSIAFSVAALRLKVSLSDSGEVPRSQKGILTRPIFGGKDCEDTKHPPTPTKTHKQKTATPVAYIT